MGIAALACWALALAQEATEGRESPAHPVIVVTGARETDEAVTMRVEKALNDDPFLYVGHIIVRTENGVVRLEGLAQDANDLDQALRIARRAARGRRIINEIELLAAAEDNDF